MDEKRVFKVFGKVLREARKERGLSQEKLAFETGYDRTFISRMERGLTQPSLVSLIKIAKACGKPVSELIKPLENKLGF